MAPLQTSMGINADGINKNANQLKDFRIRRLSRIVRLGFRYSQRSFKVEERGREGDQSKSA